MLGQQLKITLAQSFSSATSSPIRELPRLPVNSRFLMKTPVTTPPSSESEFDGSSVQDRLDWLTAGVAAGRGACVPGASRRITDGDSAVAPSSPPAASDGGTASSSARKSKVPRGDAAIPSPSSPTVPAGVAARGVVDGPGDRPKIADSDHTGPQNLAQHARSVRRLRPRPAEQLLNWRLRAVVLGRVDFGGGLTRSPVYVDHIHDTPVVGPPEQPDLAARL